MGNVREIRNIIEYAANVCQSSRISPEDLPTYILTPKEKQIETESVLHETQKQIETEQRIIATNEIKDQIIPQSFSDIEKKLIIESLLKSGGSKSKASELLGWGRTTLWRKMKKYKIE